MKKYKLNNEDSINSRVANSAHIRYINKQPMELINEYTGEMKCKVCGAVHWASIKPRSNGRYYRGSWQCQYGCKI
jgi:hypothetical protein